MGIISRFLNEPVLTMQCGNFYVVKHTDLERIITRLKVNYRYQNIYCDQNHIVIECTMTIPGSTNNIIELGEIVNETMYSKRAKLYPFTYAYRRAFDRAAIKLLDFDEEHVIADSEFNSASIKKSTKSNNSETQKQNETDKSAESEIKDDTTLLFGNMKGKTYGEVKNTAEFKKFLQWVANREISFPDERQEQLIQFKALAKEKGIS